MKKSKVILTSKGERWFRSGHPWIFEDDVLSLNDAENGEIAALYNPGNVFLGWGFYSRHSRISFRFITSDPQIPDETYWRLALQKALKSRTEILNRNQACRVACFYQMRNKLACYAVNVYSDIRIIA